LTDTYQGAILAPPKSMRKARTNINGISAVVALIGVAIVVVVVLIIVDVAHTPPPAPQDTCTL